MRHFRRLACALALGFLPGAPILGQEPAPPSLPGITVRPEEQAPDDLAPPAPTPNPQPYVSPFDLPLSYPSLEQLRFEGLTGITRSDHSLFDIPQFGTIITRQDLEERMPQDMFQTLQQEVGVLVQRTARGQASPYVRGLTGQQVLILIDGIRVNNSTFRAGANQYFNTIDPGQVERIEVLRGSQSMLYGSDAIGGAINVVTRSASPQFGNHADGSFKEIFSTADSGSYSRANIEGWVGSTGVFGGASYLNVRDLDRGGDLGRQPFTNYDQYAGDIKFNYMLDCDTLVTLALQHFEQNELPRSDRFPPFVFGPPASAPRPTFFDPQQRDLAYLRMQSRNVTDWIDAYVFTASYQRQREGNIDINNSPTFLNRDIGEFDVDTAGLTLALATDLDYAGKLTYGVDWYHDHVNAFRNRFNNNTGNFVGPLTPQFPNDSYYERTGAYLSWDVPVTDRFEVFTGVRYESIDLASTPVLTIDPPGPTPPFTRPTFISPSYHDWIGQVGSTYALTEYLKLCSSISEGFRAPNLDDLVATNTLVQQAGQDLPSINLRPEHSYTYDVGLKLDAPRFRSQMFVFWTDLEDNILRSPGSSGGLFQRTNRDSYLNGVEWQGEYLFDGGWSAYGNFAYTYGKDLIRDEPLSRIPPTQGIAGMRWREREHRKWIDLYTWLVRRQDRLNFQDFTDARIPVGGTPGFGTLNLRAGTYFGDCDNQQISLTLENILDKAYRVHGSGVDGPGFNAIVGYQIVF